MLDLMYSLVMTRSSKESGAIGYISVSTGPYRCCHLRERGLIAVRLREGLKGKWTHSLGHQMFRRELLDYKQKIEKLFVELQCATCTVVLHAPKFDRGQKVNTRVSV